jgi:hypothetical protein
MKDELKGMWKHAFVAYFKAGYLPDGTEKNRENPVMLISASIRTGHIRNTRQVQEH